MPKKMSMLTRPIRIMGFFKILSTETGTLVSPGSPAEDLGEAQKKKGQLTLRPVHKVQLLA